MLVLIWRTFAMKKTFFPFFLIFPLLSLLCTEWQRVYLATPQRSGNHWVRSMVEEASLIATGAVYCDKDPLHMKKIFPWGGFACQNGYFGNCRYPQIGERVLVKTHFPESQKTPFDELPYRKAFVIVRHPVDSFYSRYVKNPGGPLLETVPTEKVKAYIAQWKRFIRYWSLKPHVVTFKYEEMLQDPLFYLKEICRALKYETTEEDLNRAIEKFPPQGHMLKHLDKFKQSDLALIQRELGDLMELFGYAIAL